MIDSPILVAGIPTQSEPLAAVRALAEAAANQRDTTLVGSPLRLFDDAASVAPVEVSETVSPFALGQLYERSIAPTARQAKGAHLTPEAIARRLVAMMPTPSPTDHVLDPAAGGAAFLMAAADQLVAVGASAEQVIGQLAGIDIDSGAVAVAEAALAIWGLDHGVVPRALPALRQGDGLLDELPPADRLVGNPPFLNQLRSSSTHTADRRRALRDRWGDLIGAYTDDAWLFLASGLHALTESGVLAMVQPVSILAARHGEAVRRHVHEQAALVALWIGRDQVFDAAVQVCGVVLDRSGAGHDVPVTRVVGPGFEAAVPLPAQPNATEWGSAAAAALDIPNVRLNTGGPTIGDLAAVTAGFRDQFYGFVPYVSEAANADDVSDGGGSDHGWAKLVTVGMIDVLGLSWGEREFKFAKRKFVRPVVDLDALRSDDPRLAEWVDARRRPKLLMATQTKVIEVWVDVAGTAVPATPVLSIEPNDTDPQTLWMLAAALSAPVISAYSIARKFGTALSLNAMKLAARDVMETPLPVDQQAWASAAALLRTNPSNLEQFGELMGTAYGVGDESVVPWWLDRI